MGEGETEGRKGEGDGGRSEKIEHTSKLFTIQVINHFWPVIMTHIQIPLSRHIQVNRLQDKI